MKSKILHIATYVVVLCIGIAVVGWTLQHTEAATLWQQLSQVSIGWIFASMGFSLLSCWFRALRWQLQLEVGSIHTSSSTIFTALMVGYFTNQLLPRTGELVRCSLLPPRSRESFLTSLGTVIAERTIDMLILTGLLLAVLAWEFSTIEAYFAQTSFAFPIQTTLWLLGGLAGISVVGWLFRDRFQKYFDTIRTFLLNIWQGITAVIRLRSPLLFIGYTMLIWFCYWGMSYAVFFAFPLAPSVGIWELVYIGIVIMIMGSIGSAVPIPGGIGAYHAAIVFTFAALNLEAVLGSDISGQTYAIIAHGARMFVLILVGAICALVVGIRSAPQFQHLLSTIKQPNMQKKIHPERL